MNPFALGNILPGEPLCNRLIELDELSRHARNNANVLIFSQRRYGKTSLVKHVMANVAGDDFLTVYVDLFSISSKDDFIQKFSAGIMRAIGKDVTSGTFLEKVKKLFSRLIPSIDINPDSVSLSVKYDIETDFSYLIEDIFDGLNKYLSSKKMKALIVLDEFQEITELKESKNIEGILREHIQNQRNVSFFFVGSRRRVLQAMFSDRQRAFFKSAFNYPIGIINKVDLVDYICQQFTLTKKKCSEDIAGDIYEYTEGNTYYVQKLSHLLWDITEKSATHELSRAAIKTLMEAETPSFQSNFGGLHPGEKRLIKALSTEPTGQPYSINYLAKYGLTQGGVQKSIQSSIKKDIIEQDDSGTYKVTDVLLAKWCKGY